MDNIYKLQHPPLPRASHVTCISAVCDAGDAFPDGADLADEALRSRRVNSHFLAHGGCCFVGCENCCRGEEI